MHLSIHNRMWAEPVETTLARISRIGYDSIEIQRVPQLYDLKKFLEDHGSSAFTESFYTNLTQKSYDTLKPLIG